MIKIFNISLILVLLAFSSIAQIEADTSYTLQNNKVRINELTHNFGIVEKGSRTTFKFEITNSCNDILFIKHVTTSCGCTTPEWSKKLIKNGKKGNVKVNYDSNTIGSFNKSVYVYTNFDEKPIHVTIKGQVVPLLSEKKNVSKKSFNINGKLPVKQ